MESCWEKQTLNKWRPLWRLQSGLMLPAGRRRQTHTGSISQTRRTAFHSAPFSTESFILKFFFGNKYVRRGADEVCMRHKQKESWKTRVAALIQDKYWVEVQFWGTGVFLFIPLYTSTPRHFTGTLKIKFSWNLFFLHLVLHEKKKSVKKCCFVFFSWNFFDLVSHMKKKCSPEKLFVFFT